MDRSSVHDIHLRVGAHHDHDDLNLNSSHDLDASTNSHSGVRLIQPPNHDPAKPKPNSNSSQSAGSAATTTITSSSFFTMTNDDTNTRGDTSTGSGTVHTTPCNTPNPRNHPTPVASTPHVHNPTPNPISTSNLPFTPGPARKGYQKAMFRSSIEPVDSSGEWLPAVAILGQGSPAASAESIGRNTGVGVGPSISGVKPKGGEVVKEREKEREKKDATGSQRQTSVARSASTSSVVKPRPPMMPSLARLRPVSLELPESYPPDVDSDGDIPNSSDPLNSSFSAGAPNSTRQFSLSSDPRYSLMSSPPETPLEANGPPIPVGVIPPRFMNMVDGGGGEGSFGGPSGCVDIQPPQPSWMPGSLSYPVHASVQLKDMGAETSWQSYHVPRDPVQIKEVDNATTPQAASEPGPSSLPTQQPIQADETPRQPWSFPPANRQGNSSPFRRTPEMRTYYDPWTGPSPQNATGHVSSAPAAYTYGAPHNPNIATPQLFATSAPVHGVRFASGYSSSAPNPALSASGYEANDPFKLDTQSRQSDDLTFDDIPVSGQFGIPDSWGSGGHRPQHMPQGQQHQHSSSANNYGPTLYNPHTPRPSQQGSNGPMPWGDPTYYQQPGTAPSMSQNQPRPDFHPTYGNGNVEPSRPDPQSANTGSGSGPYLPLHSHNGSYYNHPYYPPTVSPAFGAWQKPDPFWRRVANTFKRASKDEDGRYDVLLPPLPPTATVPHPDHPSSSDYQTSHASATWSATATTAVRFMVVTIPCQIYIYLLLLLPSLYFSRVARIFEEADLTLSELKKMALEIGSEGVGVSSRKGGGEFAVRMQQMGLLDGFDSPGTDKDGTVKMPIAYERLKTTWEGFIDSVLREWKTFNIISVLLLSAILTILQIEEAAADPVTRHTALYSLVCALISLLYGCVYIIRFGTMRKAYKAAEWALEAKRSKTMVWWNVWILLAMPAIWLSWSLILYVACILSFAWRTGDPVSGPPSPLSSQGLLAVRVILTLILVLGVVYGCLIYVTFRRYGDAMDKKWKERIAGWIREKSNQSFPQPYPHYDTTPYYYPSFGAPPNPSEGMGQAYPHFRGPSYPAPVPPSQPPGNNHDSWAPQVQQQQQQQQKPQPQQQSQVQGTSPPHPPNHNMNEGTSENPSTVQSSAEEQILKSGPQQNPTIDEAPRYNFSDYKSSLPSYGSYGYTSDAKTQFEYGSTNDKAEKTSSGLTDKAGSSPQIQTQSTVSKNNPSQSGLPNTAGSTSASTSTVTQAPPYTSPSTSPTPPSYNAVPAYNTITNPIRFNPPLRKNPQISMPPPLSLPTIPGTPLTIATMRSFDTAAGAENYRHRDSPGAESMSMSASTSISNLLMDQSPRASFATGLSPRTASKKPVGMDESDIPASGISNSNGSPRSRSMSPKSQEQTSPLLSSNANLPVLHTRPLSDIGIGININTNGMERSSVGSARFGFDVLPPGAAPPVRTSGDAHDAN